MIKAGVLGAGHLGKIHLRLLQQSNAYELIGFYDPDQTTALKVQEEFGYRYFDSIASLIEAVDMVDIVTPTLSHYDCAIKAIEKGKHIFIEKPITNTVEEAESIRELLAEHGLRGQGGHVERFNPVMTFLDSRLTNPRFIEAIRIAPYPPSRKGAKPRGTEVSVVHDLMIHDLDVILHLNPSGVKQINATGIPVLSETEDIANVRLGFENGCVANITASRISRDQMRKIRVFQEDTYVSLDYMKQAGVLCRKNGEKIKVDKVPIEKKNALDLELESFVNCVMQRGTPVVTGEHGFEALKLAVEICKKIRTDPS